MQGSLQTPAQLQYNIPRNPVTGGLVDLSLNKPLSLDRAIRIGLLRQNTIAIAQTQIDVARNRLVQARSSYFPQVTPSFQYQNNLSPGQRTLFTTTTTGGTTGTTTSGITQSVTGRQTTGGNTGTGSGTNPGTGSSTGSGTGTGTGTELVQGQELVPEPGQEPALVPERVRGPGKPLSSAPLLPTRGRNC